MMPGEETFRQRKLGEKNPLLRLQPGYESAQTFTKIYEAALNRALQEMEDWKRGDDLQPLLVCLAEHCFKGFPVMRSIRQTMIHYYREEEEQVIRSILHNLYQECKGFGKEVTVKSRRRLFCWKSLRNVGMNSVTIRCRTIWNIGSAILFTFALSRWINGCATVLRSMLCIEMHQCVGP